MIFNRERFKNLLSFFIKRIFLHHVHQRCDKLCCLSSVFICVEARKAVFWIGIKIAWRFKICVDWSTVFFFEFFNIPEKRSSTGFYVIYFAKFWDYLIPFEFASTSNYFIYCLISFCFFGEVYCDLFPS